jgi:hypothetical protein
MARFVNSAKKSPNHGKSVRKGKPVDPKVKKAAALKSTRKRRVPKVTRKRRVPSGTWARVVAAVADGRDKRLELDDKDKKSAKLGLHQAAHQFRKANKKSAKFSLHIVDMSYGLFVGKGVRKARKGDR